MGVVRFILAAAVVFHHSTVPWNLPMVDGHQAVRLFYILSGFYMALVLHTKYPQTRQGIGLFYRNRALRIYPIYGCVLVAAIFFYGTAWIWLQRIPERFAWYEELLRGNHGLFLSGLGVSQVSLFGLDWFSLFDFRGPTIGLSGVVPNGRSVGFLCLVPQAWTLAVELGFYLLAPWLVRVKTGGLALGCLLGFVLRIGLWAWRPNETQAFNYYWLPLQMPFFLLGILGYRWAGSCGGFWKAPWRSGGALTFTLVILLGYRILPDIWNQVVSCGLLALFLPGLLEVRGVWQKWLGELSYPIYVVHILVKWIILGAQGVENTGRLQVSGLELLVGSVLVAICLVKAVGIPIEKHRGLGVAAGKKN